MEVRLILGEEEIYDLPSLGTATEAVTDMADRLKLPLVTTITVARVGRELLSEVIKNGKN